MSKDLKMDTLADGLATRMEQLQDALEQSTWMARQRIEALERIVRHESDCCNAAKERIADLECRVEQLKLFAQDIANQTPEKPDYWSSCGQCERNISYADDVLSEASKPHYAAPVPPQPDCAETLLKNIDSTNWTADEALRWYADQNHFDIVNGQTRILDTGAVASNALKHLSEQYLIHKGDAAFAELHDRAEALADALLQILKNDGGEGSKCYDASTLYQARQDGFAVLTAYSASKPRCCYCDGTGDVHTPTGEWRGICTCEAGQAIKQVGLT